MDDQSAGTKVARIGFLRVVLSGLRLISVSGVIALVCSASAICARVPACAIRPDPMLAMRPNSHS